MATIKYRLCIARCSIPDLFRSPGRPANGLRRGWVNENDPTDFTDDAGWRWHGGRIKLVMRSEKRVPFPKYPITFASWDEAANKI